ncbi:hypothetical protein [Nannocystis pusilla]|uniref:Uncharacterized protein n=1 Tax=Nannocystis pusilla TaxID=889268 RepID=A0ABS7U320_9BACT|nr:hypothetical protein [Nannocystis pusilla]MBZ5714829.1 hypothetical protein [Nannocystis pusilla]
MLFVSAVQHRRRLKATDHGRSEGWDVLLADRVVAYLDDPRFEDMFWISYRVTPLTDDADLAARLLTPEYWRSDEGCTLTFRSRALGVFAPNAFASLGMDAPGRVAMRALYITPEVLAAAPGPATPSPDETLTEPRPRGWFARALRGLRRCFGGSRSR